MLNTKSTCMLPADNMKYLQRQYAIILNNGEIWAGRPISYANSGWLEQSKNEMRKFVFFFIVVRKETLHTRKIIMQIYK